MRGQRLPPRGGLAARGTPSLTRRQFIGYSAAAAASMAAGWPLRGSAARAGGDERVVIIGAGLAGLRCARLLVAAGIQPQLFEASGRVGGRCWTNRGFFAGGQIAEHGAEFVSSEHVAVRHLAGELGLSLEVSNGGALPTGQEVYWTNGRYYRYAEANADWGDAYPAFKSAIASAPAPQSYNHHNHAGYVLDHMSVPEWIDKNIDGGTAGRFGQLLLTNVISEYGGDPEDQSALNLVYVLGYNPRNSLAPLAGTDEKYHVVGGNDQLATGMASRLPADTIRTNAALVAVRATDSGAYRCNFQSDSGAFDVRADRVVLAIPFSTLRHVDLSEAGLSPLKLRAIRELGMGSNAKLAVQLRRKPWASEGFDGVAYSGPSDFEVVWDATTAQAGPDGILVNYTGGARGRSYRGGAFGPAPGDDVDEFLERVEPVFPGTTAAFTGRAYRDFWHADPWHRGAYSYFRVGQYTAFSGYEKVQEGNIHFCGEHTSRAFQGYMEGALESAERVAEEITPARRLIRWLAG